MKKILFLTMALGGGLLLASNRHLLSTKNMDDNDIPKVERRNERLQKKEMIQKRKSERDLKIMLRDKQGTNYYQ